MGVATNAAACALAPDALRFERSLERPEQAQARVLADLTRRLAASRYGRRLGVRTPDDFLKRVPVVDYESIEPWLAAERRGERGALTPERTLFYERTSGSSGTSKLIPYTRGLRRSFTRMFGIWAHDVVRHGPALSRGRLYFSVSPSFGPPPPKAPSGVQVGLQDDREYLTGAMRQLLRPFVVDPGHTRGAPDAHTFKQRTAELLLREPRLEIISIWNPTFLQVLLEHIEEHAEALIARAQPSRERAEAVRRGDWPAVWPQLRLISCWTSASATPQAAALAKQFEGVTMQGKGLLATEAPITVPYLRAPGYVPMIDEVFIELEDESGGLTPVYAAEEGREYDLVFSQRGGLYRYRIGDRVRVGASYRNTPTLDFVGRAGGVSDLVGEKLNESFVRACLRRLGVAPDVFASLVPRRHPREHYVLLSDRPLTIDAADIDAELQRAHHYAHARALGQLAPPRVHTLPDAPRRLWEWAQRSGVAAGDVKHRTLETRLADAELRRVIDASSVARDEVQP